ncbi:MAG: TonB-dependent receptor [Sphingobium sp.]
MRVSFKAALGISSAIASLAVTSTAMAQAGDATGNSGGDEIVVTAQKREQRLLDVPVAVSAVSSGSLIEQNLVSIRDFATRIPGLQISGSTTQDIALRGVTTGGGTNPTVAVLIDDVQFGSSTYLGKPPLPDLDPATLQRVEVLRGPQGTLYGASSLGGLVKYVTKDPSTTDFSGHVEVGAGSVKDGTEGWSVRGSINAPIVADKIGLSVSGFYRNDPRYIDTILPSDSTLVKNATRNEVYGGRAALILHPVDILTVTLSALYQKQNAQGPTAINICSACAPIPAAGSAPVTVTFDPRGVSDLRTASAAIVPTENEIQLYTARLALDLDAMQITSVTAWGRNEQATAADSTSRFGTALEYYAGYPTGQTYIFAQPLLTNKFTQELRFSNQGSQFDWLAGLFYTNERSNLRQVITRTGSESDLTVYDGSNISTYEEKAVFADLTYHVTDRFDVQGGLRYAQNQQSYRVLSVIETSAQALFGSGEDSLFQSKENAITWLVTPSYRFNPNLMTYVRVASGYRPGGPNTDTPGAAATFKSDSVVSYEWGVKGALLDDRLTFDATLFHVAWKDIQLQNTALPSQFTFFENGKKARSRGFEMSGQYRPWNGFAIDANATILDAVLTQSIEATTDTVQRLAGKAGDRLPYSAKFSGNLSMQQDFALSDSIGAFAGFNLNYVGNRMALFNQNSTSAVIARAKLPSYTVVDLRAGLNFNGRWKANIYVRNLFDKEGITSIATTNGTTLPQATFITPRTIGLTLSADF